MELGQLFKTICAAAAMAIVVKFFHDLTLAQWHMEIFSTFGAIGVGCVIYVATLALIGGLLEEDMARIPMIGRFGIKIFRKLGIFK